MAHPVVVEQSRAIPISPSEALAKTLPIPPIKAVHGQAGEWATVGQTRTISLTGGGGMRETLTSIDAPRSFGYTLNDVRGAMAPLIDRIEGEWVFTPHGTGTKVTWRWTLHPKSALSAPLLPVFARIWRGYARQAMETLSGHLVG